MHNPVIGALEQSNDSALRHMTLFIDFCSELWSVVQYMLLQFLD